MEHWQEFIKNERKYVIDWFIKIWWWKIKIQINGGKKQLNLPDISKVELLRWVKKQ